MEFLNDKPLMPVVVYIVRKMRADLSELWLNFRTGSLKSKHIHENIEWKQFPLIANIVKILTH